MSLLPALPALVLLAGAALAVVAPVRNAGNAAARVLAVSACGLGVFVTVLLWSSGRIGGSGTFDGDSLSLFFGGLLLLSIGFTVSIQKESAAAVVRLLATGALTLVAVSTRELAFALPAIGLGLVAAREEGTRLTDLTAPLLTGAGFLASLGLLYRAGGATDLAAIASATEAGSPSGRAGLVVLVVSLYAGWFFENRRSLRLSTASLVTRTASSFLQLVAVTSIFLRLGAWLPDAAPLGLFGAFAVASLAVGALGMLGSTRVTTFATALAVARAGVVLAALPGGVHGRAALLVELAVTGIALLLVAYAVDGFFAVDEISGQLPLAARLALLTGALAAAGFPPSPGFVAAFPLASALLSAGRVVSAAALCGAFFLIGLGSMRLAARAFAAGDASPSKRNHARDGGAFVVVVVALAAIGWLGIVPGAFWEIAARAALGIF